MPVDLTIADENWQRYVYLRENGHLDFIEKANICDAFVLGDQWNKADVAQLRAVRRPALTINQTLPTVATLMGEQINTRVDIAVKAVKSGAEDISDVLERLFHNEHDRNLYPAVESEVFDDGAITSRGYFDLRLCWDKNMQGQAELCAMNPRNVLPDCDAEHYDPEKWNDVLITKWMAPIDIEHLYNKEDADYLRDCNPDDFHAETYDSIHRKYETFRTHPQQASPFSSASREYTRNIRVLERQKYVLAKQKVFVDIVTGDTSPVPEEWSRDKIGFVMKKYNLSVVDMLMKRIRWTVTAGPCRLHDDWSPYRYFTIVPYFPYFRRGKTMGVVETLLSPQELLNKAMSQELHVINTTANSGWKIKQNALRNMTVDELEQRGAQTGIVLELSDTKDAEKIEPNQIPTGLDRIVTKAESFMQTVSTVNDTTLGNDREDVAAKAIRQKTINNSKTHAKIFDNLNTTRLLLARRWYWLMKDYYTEPRVERMVKDEVMGEYEDVQLNTYDEAIGRVVNDLSVGEYEITIVTTPNKDTVQEAEFDQAIAMRELGVAIPDAYLIENSNLKGKRKLLKAMKSQAQTPEAQQAAALQQRAQVAEIENTEADTERTQADTVLKSANAKRAMAEALNPGNPGENPQLEALRMQHEAAEGAADRAQDAANNAHEAAMQSSEQQHEAGMARLGHAQTMQEGQVEHQHAVQEGAVQHAQALGQGVQQHQHTIQESEQQHKQSLQAADKNAQHQAAADKRKAKQMKQKPTTKKASNK